MVRELTRAAKCAQMIRAELKTKFPNIEFRVKSKNYSGGDSVDIYYTDGPKAEKVEEITGKYKKGHFDGMDDSYKYNNDSSNLPQSYYVFVKREMSDTIKQRLIDEHNAKYGEDGQIKDLDAWNKDSNCWNSSVLWREFSEMEF